MIVMSTRDFRTAHAQMPLISAYAGVSSKASSLTFGVRFQLLYPCTSLPCVCEQRRSESLRIDPSLLADAISIEISCTCPILLQIEQKQILLHSDTKGA